MKNGTKNITLKVNTELYEKFRKYCKERELIISRQFEIFIEKELRKRRRI